MTTDLPINAVLPDIGRALAAKGCGVLIAPPGAGKTTAVAPALLGEDWCDGQILLTSPRRVAARAAAERIAEMLGEKGHLVAELGDTFDDSYWIAEPLDIVALNLVHYAAARDLDHALSVHCEF